MLGGVRSNTTRVTTIEQQDNDTTHYTYLRFIIFSPHSKDLPDY